MLQFCLHKILSNIFEYLRFTSLHIYLYILLILLISISFYSNEEVYFQAERETIFNQILLKILGYSQNLFRFHSIIYHMVYVNLYVWTEKVDWKRESKVFTEMKLIYIGTFNVK